jgi:hypothetical protein
VEGILFLLRFLFSVESQLLVRKECGASPPFHLYLPISLLQYSHNIANSLRIWARFYLLVFMEGSAAVRVFRTNPRISRGLGYLRLIFLSYPFPRAFHAFEYLISMIFFRCLFSLSARVLVVSLLVRNRPGCTLPSRHRIGQKMIPRLPILRSGLRSLPVVGMYAYPIAPPSGPVYI